MSFDRAEIFDRSRALVDLDNLERLNLSLIGCGSLGSCIALSCSKLGVGTLTLYDNDLVESANVGNQLYGEESVGMLKTCALSHIVKRHTTPDLRVYEEGLYTNQLLSRVVISALDNMKTRVEVWREVKRQDRHDLYMDFRGGLDQLLVYFVKNEGEGEAYERELYTDEEAERATCGARGISYLPFLAASIAGRALRYWSTREAEKLPFFLAVDLTNFSVFKREEA